MATLSEPVVMDDVLKWMVDSRFCCAALTLKANTVQSVEVGSPLYDNTGYCIVPNGQEANAVAIALEAVEATNAEIILCLVRGPALIDSDRLHLETSVTWAELTAYFAALDIRALTEPTQLTEGTDS